MNIIIARVPVLNGAEFCTVVLSLLLLITVSYIKMPGIVYISLSLMQAKICGQADA